MYTFNCLKKYIFMKLCLLTIFIFLVCVPAGVHSGWNYKHCQGPSYQQDQHIIINNNVCLSEQNIDCFTNIWGYGSCSLAVRCSDI